MRKFGLKVTSLIMGAAMLLPNLAACDTGNGGNTNGDFKYTGNETELHIGVFDGGLGHDWIEKVALEFDKTFANVSFVNGELGVHTKINPQKKQFATESVQQAISLGSDDMEDIYYLAVYTGAPYISKGYSANITDAVCQKVYLENGELADMEFDTATGKLKLKEGAEAPTMSLQDKMVEYNRTGYYKTAEELDYNKDGSPDVAEGYYALPFENSLSGFIYDHDLLEEYDLLDYSGIDGLPDTIDELFDLFDRLVALNIIPFTGAKGASGYWGGLTDAFISQYEGYENAELNYTYDGVYTFDGVTAAKIKQDYPTIENEEWITVNGDGSYTAEITPENAWILMYQPGKEKLVQFYRDLFSPEYFDQTSHLTTFDYIAAQKQFVLSKLQKQGQKRIAMIYEGEWWENETRANFSYTGGYGTRDFRFLPLPEIEGQKDPSVRTVADYSRGVDLFVNNKSKVKDLCELWLQFSHTETALETFTLTTGITRLYDYDLDDEQLSTLSKFAQNTYKIKMTNETGITVTGSRANLIPHEFYLTSKITGYGADLCSSIAKTTQSGFNSQSAQAYFWDNCGENGTTKVSAATFISGMYELYNKEAWEASYNSWVNK